MIDYEKLYKLCRNKNYYFIFKVHPFVDEKAIIPEHCKNYMMDASSIREINDLLFITDILITDYSSTCFEFALFDRPMLFFAYDLEEYIATRDFYYDYTEFVPGKICRSTEELVTAIENQDYEIEKVNEFRHRFFDDVDGKSTDRVIDQIILRKEKGICLNGLEK
jgi:CDP-ribitol ribitolphosphotransferase